MKITILSQPVCRFAVLSYLEGILNIVVGGDEKEQSFFAEATEKLS